MNMKRVGKEMFWYWLFWQCDESRNPYLTQVHRLLGYELGNMT